MKVFLLIKRFCSAANKLVLAIANEASDSWSSYKVADPKSNFVWISSIAFNTAS